MISIARLTNQGGREYNEDTVDIFRDGKRMCLVVADGLGGHGGGKTASMTAAETILSAFPGQEDADQEWLKSIFQRANSAVLAKQTERCQMKTTCVTLCITEGKAAWAHVGDSRLYHFIGGRMFSVTMDHSVSQLAVLSGEIEASEIRFHADRNKVLRAMGVDETVKPSVDTCKLQDGRFHAFLLCTDGFWEYVLEGEMEIDLAKAQTAEEWIQFMEERLVKKVDGRHDNYSAAAVFYQADGGDSYEKEGF